MNSNIDYVVFTFPTICQTCVQEEYDNDNKEEYPDQKLLLLDILESGTPLCTLCDNELEPDTDCEILV